MGYLQHTGRTRALYHRLARVYDVVYPFFSGPSRTRQRYFSFVDLHPDDHVLDLGCGTGLSTIELRERVDKVDALDISERQIRRARGKADLVSARFVRGDAQQLPYCDGAFDAVVSIGIYPYLPDPRASMTEASRVTRTGGRLLAVGPKRPESPVAGRLADSLMYVASPAEMRDLLGEAGWRDLGVHVVPIDWHPRDALVCVGRA